jgi:hypothetical protein
MAHEVEQIALFKLLKETVLNVGHDLSFNHFRQGIGMLRNVG